jgi:putative MATE family efflux protein
MRKDTKTLMETAPVLESIITLALPMMLGMIAQMVYNMTDTFFIGQTGNPNMVAGISLVFPLFMVSQGIGNIFGIGAASYISRKLGERRLDTARQTNVVSFYTTLVVGIVITVALFLLKSPILRLVGASKATLPYADSYFSIISLFIVFAILSIGLSGQIRSEGATHEAMRGMLLGIVTNIILDPVFILALGWGVAGAAWATIIGQIVSTLYFIVFFLSKKTTLSIRPRDFKPSKTIYAEILKIGIPAALSNVIMTASAILTNRIAASYGDTIVAASGINQRITSIAFMLIMALAMGYQPFAGYNYGAKNYERLKEGLKVTLLCTTSLALVFIVIFLLAHKPLVWLFIRDEATVEAGGTLIRAFVWGLPFMGIQMTLMTTYQALGKPLLTTIVTMGRQFLFYIPLLLILNRLWQFNGYIYSQPIADILTSGIALLLSRVVFKEMRGPSKMDAPILEG